VIVLGFAKNGFKFLRVFVPSGVPWYILWFVVLIEVISFFSRPLSHSVRLWANILAGHLVLKVFAGFVPMMIESGNTFVGVGAILPLAMTVAIYALEFLVAFLQAYVFAMLTCVYLNDALHPGH
jgi:F-type H+-transporting ATPase subunit a